jgi:hypothetical protein
MTLDELRDRGERIRRHFNKELDLSLDYDQQAVEWLDGYINRNRHVFSGDKKYGWAVAFGYVLGEAVIRVFGGRWVQDDRFTDEWVVELGDPLGSANPIGKVYKYLDDPSDSVLSFFNIIGMAKEKGGFDKIGEPITPQ